VETANEGRFSSQNVMQWNEVDGPIKFTHLIYYLSSYLFIPTLNGLSQGTSLAHPSINNFKKRKKKINQTKLALASTLFVFSGSAWSCKTGKRMMKSHPFFFFLFFFFLREKERPTHQVQVQKTSPQVNSNKRKKREKSPTKS
jgi:hypothetical protein